MPWPSLTDGAVFFAGRSAGPRPGLIRDRSRFPVRFPATLPQGLWMKLRHLIPLKFSAEVLTFPVAVVGSLALVACGPPAPTKTPHPTGSSDTETEPVAPCEEAEADCAQSSARTRVTESGSVEAF